ncbi:HNH endonuclease [Natronorubrum sp. A-ect3]|uniref:HNH endonuclease n=1 Tax=Natronorubrum sp. A-ect3 TaxID=3242698 RepID=UPI00359E54A4
MVNLNEASADQVLSTANSSPTFKQAMGNSENWLTAYRHSIWGMREGLEDRYNELSIGDVILFRTYRESNGSKEWGIIGYGVIGRKSEKDKPLWPDEVEDGVNRYPWLLFFKETYWHGSVERIEDEHQINKNQEQVQQEIDCLREGMLTLNEIDSIIGYELHDINLWNVAGENARRIIDLLHRIEGVRADSQIAENLHSEPSPDSLSTQELYQRASEDNRSQNTSTSRTEENQPSGSVNSPAENQHRSELVKQYAKEWANGTCQGCGNPASFEDQHGESFLEVHHVHRLSDGGPDEPENVIAICPNCHRRAHHGKTNPDSIKNSLRNLSRLIIQLPNR